MDVNKAIKLIDYGVETRNNSKFTRQILNLISVDKSPTLLDVFKYI